MIPVTIGNTAIRSNDDGLISITDLFQAAQAQGFIVGKLDPRSWGQAPRAKKSWSSGKTSISGGPTGKLFLNKSKF